MLKSELTKLVGAKTDLVESIIGGLEEKVKADQRELLRLVVEDLVDKMETKDGRILNNAKNKRLLVLLDEVYTRYASTNNISSVKTILDGVQQIVNFNNDYFKVLAKPAKLAPLQADAVKTINTWLGLTTEGGLAKNGYLDTLVKDPAIKNDIRNQLTQAVITQGGYQQTKTGLQEYIVGKPEETGALQRYYRNFVFDLFSQVDRANADLIAQGLELEHAIYEGGIIKTTRPFCRARNGKVFTRAEIAAFDPPTAKPPGYNPFTDLGGYGCRHHLNWIPEALAFLLRPDLKEGTPPAAIPAPKAEPVKAKPEPAPAAEPSIISKIKTLDDYKTAVRSTLGSLTKSSPQVVWNVNAYGKERAVQSIQQIEKLSNEYQPYTEYGTFSKVTFKSTSRAYGKIVTYNNGKNIAQLNFGDKYDTAGSRIYKKDADVLRGKSRVDPENLPLSTLTHEYAHFISTSRQMNSGDPRVTEFWPKLQDLRAAYHRELMFMKANNASNPEINELYLGAYASTNENEFMAEAFTEYKLSSTPSKYAVLVGKLIDKNFKK